MISIWILHYIVSISNFECLKSVQPTKQKSVQAGARNRVIGIAQGKRNFQQKILQEL